MARVLQYCVSSTNVIFFYMGETQIQYYLILLYKTSNNGILFYIDLNDKKLYVMGHNYTIILLANKTTVLYKYIDIIIKMYKIVFK